MRVDWCVSSWFRIKNTHSLTHAPYTMLRNKSDPTGYSMPILGGQWNGTGRWRISDYLLPD